MTHREIKQLYKSISPSSGFILNLTRTELEDIVYDTTGLELEEFTGSNSKRLEQLLLVNPNSKTTELVNKLIQLKEEYDTKRLITRR